MRYISEHKNIIPISGGLSIDLREENWGKLGEICPELLKLNLQLAPGRYGVMSFETYVDCNIKAIFGKASLQFSEALTLLKSQHDEIYHGGGLFYSEAIDKSLLDEYSKKTDTIIGAERVYKNTESGYKQIISCIKELKLSKIYSGYKELFSLEKDVEQEYQNYFETLPIGSLVESYIVENGNFHRTEVIETLRKILKNQVIFNKMKEAGILKTEISFESIEEQFSVEAQLQVFKEKLAQVEEIIIGCDKESLTDSGTIESGCRNPDNRHIDSDKSLFVTANYGKNADIFYFNALNTVHWKALLLYTGNNNIIKIIDHTREIWEHIDDKTAHSWSLSCANHNEYGNKATELMKTVTSFLKSDVLKKTGNIFFVDYENKEDIPFDYSLLGLDNNDFLCE
jgi:hypothetical protein